MCNSLQQALALVLSQQGISNSDVSEKLVVALAHSLGASHQALTRDGDGLDAYETAQVSSETLAAAQQCSVSLASPWVASLRQGLHSLNQLPDNTPNRRTIQRAAAYSDLLLQ
jgi:hypothetical protein